MNAETLISLLRNAKINVSTEAHAQRDLAALFSAAGCDVRPEYRLSAADRIDFMIGRIGIEVKIGHPRRAILRQLERYAKSDEVDILILVTGTAFPSSGLVANEKPIYVANLAWGWM